MNYNRRKIPFNPILVIFKALRLSSSYVGKVKWETSEEWLLKDIVKSEGKVLNLSLKE